MNVLIKILVAVVMITLTLAGSAGQIGSAQATAYNVMEDPEVLSFFYDLHYRVQAEIERKRGADPAAMIAFRDAALRYFGLGSADFDAITPVARQVATGLQVFDQEAVAHRDAAYAARRGVDVQILTRIHERRNAALVQWARDMEKGLSPEGRQAVRRRLLELKAKIQRVPLEVRK
ncbi:MAG: hypothetical protein ACKV22_41560 [Bryobacteraceae bacterium]